MTCLRHDERHSLHPDPGCGDDRGTDRRRSGRRPSRRRAEQGDRRDLDMPLRLCDGLECDLRGDGLAVRFVANRLGAFAPVGVQDAARAVLESYWPAVTTGPEIKPTNLIALGRGRRKQLASTVTDTVQENHVVWLIRQVLSRQI